MKYLKYLLIGGLVLPAFLAQAEPGPMSLWFTTPGVPGNTISWQQEALPIGNGKLAAMVYGGVGTEQIQFNEDTIWGGQPHDYSNPNSTPALLAALQTKCFNRAANATILADATASLMGIPIREAAYQAPGSLVLTFPHSGTANYLKSLDLNTATVNVHYDYDGVTYHRDIFASAPSNRVIALRFTASESAKISFTCSFTTAQSATYGTSGNDLVMHAAVSAIADPRYFNGGLTNAIKYDARVRLLATGGTVTSTSSSLTVTNADEVTLLLSVVSNFKKYDDLTADYVTICSNNVAAAAALGYPALRQAQQADYTNLFNRVVLDLGGNSRTNQPLGYRKKQIAVDGNDPQLVALDFQLGRYLMIAGSRPGSQALNLQGKWNDVTNPDWDSKMTLNINQEMNYWGAEVCNLSECALPLMDMIQDLAITGNKVAKSNYFSNGWVVHHNTDLWRDAAPCNSNDGIWPTGGAWLSQHVWWHYLFTGDTNWLATTGYPLMKSAAQFFQGYLVTHPTYGYKVTCPSYSPEHDETTYNVANVPGPTMDNELCRDLFNNVIAASQVLGVDAAFRSDIATLRDQLPPDKVGKYGQLQEWLEDVDANPDGHRHCSHLVGLSPGEEISTFYTPTTALAAKVSVDFRNYANSTLTPWGCAVRVNLRTRLMDGDGAWTNLMFLYGYSKVSTNLIFADNHRQVDAIFGRLSGIAEMFLQSQNGDLILLPALPTALTNGMVSGLCARGGFEVNNLTWTNGQLAGATILSKAGNLCNLRSKWPVIIKQGANLVSAPMVLPGLYQFATTTGESCMVQPATIAEAEYLAVTTSGATQQILTNAALSNWRASKFNATGTGNSVTYTVNNVPAGNYHLVVTANAGTNGGQFQLACRPGGGSFANVGSVQDTYSPTNVVYLIPLKINTPTNVIALCTNLQREFDCGNWIAPSNGNYDFKLTVTGKNASSSGYALTVDYFKFEPVNVAPTNQPPVAPTNQTPSAGALEQSTAPTLQSSAFIDLDGGDTHAASQWLVQRQSDNALVYDSGMDAVHLNTLALSAGVLDFGTTYRWQTRHEDNHGDWSAYSAATIFATMSPSLVSSFQTGAGKIVFAWPTNSTGFLLQYATNLASPDWLPVLPEPNLAGGLYVVTNASTNAAAFYRLVKSGDTGASLQ